MIKKQGPSHHWIILSEPPRGSSNWHLIWLHPRCVRIRWVMVRTLPLKEDDGMRFFVDEAEFNRSVDASIGEVVRAIKERAAMGGRVVMGWQLDGNDISEEALLASSAGSEVRATTKDIRVLVRESLVQTEEYFPILVNGISAVADKLEGGSTEEALKLFQQATEGIGWVLQVVQHCGMLLGTSDQGDGMAEDYGALQAALENVASPLKEGKFLQMALKIREELIPTVQRLAPHIAKLREEADRAAN